MATKSSQPSRQESQTLSDWMDHLAQDLRDTARQAMESYDADAIHDARVATRRLRAAADLIEPVIGQSKDLEKFTRALKRIRKQLGPLRDLDVMLGHLDERWAHGRHAQASQWVRDRLVQCRDEHRAKLGKKRSIANLLSSLGAGWGVMEEIRDAEQQIRQTVPGRIIDQLATFTSKARVLSDNAPSPDGTPADPHALRIAGKHLRYTLEITDATGLDVPGRILKSFKKVQDALGLWHDYAVLAQEIQKLLIDAELVFHDRVLYPKLLHFTQAAWNKSQQQLAGFIAMWKETGAEIEQGVSGIVPPANDGAAPVEQSAMESSTPDTAAEEPPISDALNPSPADDIANDHSPDPAADDEARNE